MVAFLVGSPAAGRLANFLIQWWWLILILGFVANEIRGCLVVYLVLTHLK